MLIVPLPPRIPYNVAIGAAFAEAALLVARQAGRPNNVPAATGAAHPVVLGSLTPEANYRDLLRGVVAAPAEPPQRIEIVADRSLPAV